MARTNDPHAATVKAWETRARNAGGGGVVQGREDWAKGKGIDRKRVQDLLYEWGDGIGIEASKDPKTAAGKEMTQALNTLPVFKGTLYRGMSIKTKDAERLREGGTFDHTTKLHSNASKDRDHASSFIGGFFGGDEPGKLPVLLKITGWGRDFSKSLAGREMGEREVVLMAGNRLRIDSIERGVSGGQDAWGRTLGEHWVITLRDETDPPAGGAR